MVCYLVTDSSYITLLYPFMLIMSVITQEMSIQHWGQWAVIKQLHSQKAMLVLVQHNLPTDIFRSSNFVDNSDILLQISNNIYLELYYLSHQVFTCNMFLGTIEIAFIISHWVWPTGNSTFFLLLFYTIISIFKSQSESKISIYLACLCLIH